MPNWVLIDDQDEQVGYSSGWSVVTGSNRQWNAGVHSTTRRGSSAQIMFKGVSVAVWATIPAGSGVQIAQYSIDGGPAVQIRQQQRNEALYNIEILRVENLSEGRVHSLIVSNLGSSSDAALQLDKFKYLPASSDPDPNPVIAPAPPLLNTAKPSSTTTRAPSITPAPPSPVQSGNGGSDENLTSQDTVLSLVPNQSNLPASSHGRSSPQLSSSTDSLSSLSDGTRYTSDGNGIATQIVQASVTYRMVTVTDANGGVSTQTQTLLASSNGGISKATLTGVVIGCIAGVGGLLLIAILIVWRKRRRRGMEGGVRALFGEKSINPEVSDSEAYRGAHHAAHAYPFHRDSVASPSSLSRGHRGSSADSILGTSVRRNEGITKINAYTNFRASSQLDEDIYSNTSRANEIGRGGNLRRNEPPPAYGSS